MISSVSNAPSGFTTALAYAADQLDALITNPITVSISVSWDSSVFGEGGPVETQGFAYSTVAAALKSHAEGAAAAEAAANLPTQDPTRDGYLYLSDAQAEALGLELSSSGPGADGAVTFGTAGQTLNFSTTDAAVPNEYDFVGIAEHELTHALGRYGSDSGSPQYILDLYRYGSPGTLQTNGTNPTYFSIDGGRTALATFSTSSDLSDWAPSSVDDFFDAYAYPNVANTISSVDDTLLSALGFDVACFTPGTHILTPGGDRPVEQLAIGDPVITKLHGTQKIKWIGISRYDGRFVRNNHLMLPVCLKRHAIENHVPARDLWVSPGHAICLDGVLVPAWRLVNGVTIFQATSVETVTYYHLELETHDVLVTENCPTESFLDDNCRHQFQNAAEYDRLYPTARAPQTPCLPRVEDGFHLQDIQHHLNRRAGLPRVLEIPGPLRGFVDVAGPDRVAGWAQCEAQPEIPVCLDIAVDGRCVARTLANRYRADLRKAGLGSGTHSFDLPLPAGLSPAAVIEVRRSTDHAPLPLTEAAHIRAA